MGGARGRARGTAVWRLAALGFSAAVLGLLAPSLPAAGARVSPTLTISPSRGAPGITVTVSGADFPKGTLVALAWDGSTANLPTASTRANGSFRVQIIIPDTSPGSHTVGATARSVAAGAIFEVLAPVATSSPTPALVPTATATPASLPPTATATATATSLPPAATATTTPMVTATPAAPAVTLALAGFVTRSGVSLVLDGTPFRFVGANMYNAAGDPSIYECGPWMGNPDVELDDWFARARRDFDGRVIRFWAYQSYTNGGTDWRALDRVMRLADRHGLKVIPVLENQWADCTQGGYKYDTWYAGGYLSPYGGYPLSFREYVRRVVTRYAQEPAVAAWMLMNEAESKTTGGVPNPEALYAFARDLSAYVKSLDPNHLVTLGVMGSGQPGGSGSDYERLHGLPTIDFAEYHDYGQNDEALPGAPLPPPTAPLSTELYTQDAGWTWRGQGFRQHQARVWESWTGSVPAGAQPFQRIGLSVYGAYVGDAYVDHVQIGSRVYGFEDGTTQGWQATAGITLSNAGTISYAGSRALKLTFSATGGAQVWIPALPEDSPGTPITIRMYVDTPGSVEAYNTLVAAMYKARQLNKPILVGESGMTTCGPYEGWQPETPDSRARKLDAKLGAFFGNGGAGYLIWTWHPTSDCSHDFTTGDPLNAVLARHSGFLRGQ